MSSFITPEIQKTYLARRNKDIQECRKRLEQADWFFFENLGHQLKGNASSFGYDDLTLIAKKIESFGREKDSQSLQSVIEDFKKWYEKHAPEQESQSEYPELLN